MARSERPARDERRVRIDRRAKTWRAAIVGAWDARRRALRRAEPAGLGSVDWHAPQWFAAALIVLMLSMADTFLTLVLVQHGAMEINPLMAPLVMGGGRSFAFLKLAMTATGVTILVLLARVPAFGRLLAGPILVTAALVYAALLSYELWLLDQLSD